MTGYNRKDICFLSTHLRTGRNMRLQVIVGVSEKESESERVQMLERRGEEAEELHHVWQKAVVSVEVSQSGKSDSPFDGVSCDSAPNGSSCHETRQWKP